MTSGRVAVTTSRCLMHLSVRFSVLQYDFSYRRRRRRRGLHATRCTYTPASLSRKKYRMACCVGKKIYMPLVSVTSLHTSFADCIKAVRTIMLAIIQSSQLKSCRATPLTQIRIGIVIMAMGKSAVMTPYARGRMSSISVMGSYGCCRDSSRRRPGG